MKGTVTAIMLNSAVARMLPDRHYALIDSANRSVVGASKGGQQVESAAFVAAGKPDDGLFYSEVIALDTKDPTKPFKLWAGRPRAEFIAEPEMVKIGGLRLIGAAVPAAVAFLGLLAWAIRLRIVRAARNKAIMQESLNRRTAEFAELGAERERERRAADEARLLAEVERAAAASAAAAVQAEVVQALAAGLDRLAGGDLMFRLDDRLAPEYEKLRGDFNGAIDKLREAMGGIAGAARTIGSVTQEIAGATDDLSRRTEQQAASLEETAAALDEITATINRTSETSQHARDVVSAARADAEKSAGVVDRAIEAMHGIDQSSKQITQIIGVIDEIAFQTNLLALNAGVEAARAGDAGRGFAVVASEVRALAQRSADAAKQIKGLISTSSGQVGRGVDLVVETGKALQRIVAQVAEIDAVVSAISAGAKEQATGLHEVNTSVNEMDHVTQQNAAMVEETTAAAQSLAGETRELEQLVARFDIGEPAAPARGADRATFARAASKSVAPPRKLRPARVA